MVSARARSSCSAAGIYSGSKIKSRTLIASCDEINTISDETFLIIFRLIFLFLQHVTQLIVFIWTHISVLQDQQLIEATIVLGSGLDRVRINGYRFDSRGSGDNGCEHCLRETIFATARALCGSLSIFLLTVHIKDFSCIVYGGNAVMFF